MPKPKPTEEELELREKRRMEWRSFRLRFLFTQAKLAEILGVSRRTVQSVEAGRVTPATSTLRMFLALKARHEGGKAA